MNVLPFVLAIFFILSYGMAASLQARLSMHRNQKAYVALRGAERRILQSSEREQFKTLSGDLVEKKRSENKGKQSLKKSAPPINSPCSRLNLYPLIAEGKDAHPALYEKTAALFRIFYGQELFKEQKRFEYKLLDALISGAKKTMKEQISLPLETISMKDSELQSIYYMSLKGTKQYDLSKKGYPPLIDYLKINKGTAKICLFHCNPDMLMVFFGPKTAPKLYEELHSEGAQKEGMDLEAILAWASDPELRFVDPGVWDLIDFRRAKHSLSERQTLVGQEDGVSIRKDVFLKLGS